MQKFIRFDLVLYIALLVLGLGGFLFAFLMPSAVGFYTFVICAALGGVGVTFYIYYAKRFKKSLACPTGDDCNAVVNSKYSRFLGIHNEYLGMLYYLGIVASYAAFLVYEPLRSGLFMGLVLIATAGAFLFSIYLIFIQAFVLKKWCIWCLLSAVLSTGIFLASLVSLSFIPGFLVNIIPFFIFLKSLGYVLGMGSSITAVFLFNRFLGDMDISDIEAGALNKISELSWSGIGLIFISQISIYLTNPELLSSAPVFVVESVVLIIVFITGAILNILFSPFLGSLPFGKNAKNKKSSPLSSLRRATLLNGSLTLSSWFFAFSINFIPPYDTGTLFTAYIIFILLSLGGALFWDSRVS